MVLSILSKLIYGYSTFNDAFHSNKLALGASYKIPSLDAFVASLLQEKYKLSQMGLQNTSKEHALATNEGKKVPSK